MESFHDYLQKINESSSNTIFWGAMNLQEVIQNFVRDSERNCLTELDGTRIFDDFVLGVADGDDPLFLQYQESIGAFHFLPRVILKSLFPQWKDKKDACRVICWVLPITSSTKQSNAVQNRYPSEQWAHTKLYGEQFNEQLRRVVVDTLTEKGYHAVAPALSPLFQRRCYGLSGRASSWSERHILFAAGLGTFSLNDGFITAEGMAMRCGSVVTNMEIAPTTRKYASHLENCLFYNGGSCRACIDRCPVNAINENGHDKVKCQTYCNETAAQYVFTQYGIQTSCCGLCQTGVPCESKNPKAW